MQKTDSNANSYISRSIINILKLLVVWIAVYSLGYVVLIRHCIRVQEVTAGLIIILGLFLVFFIMTLIGKFMQPQEIGLRWSVKYLLEPFFISHNLWPSKDIINEKEMARNVWYWRNECIDTTRQCLRILRYLGKEPSFLFDQVKIIEFLKYGRILPVR